MTPEFRQPPVRLPLVRPQTIMRIDAEMISDMVGFSNRSRALMLKNDPYLAEFILDGGEQIQTMQGDPSGLILGASAVWRMLHEENPDLPPYVFNPTTSIGNLQIQNKARLMAQENYDLALYLTTRAQSFASIASGASFSTGGVAVYLQKRAALDGIIQH